MRKLILQCGLSPGDIVMLTAAVRDLHFWHPGRFLTDVRTPCREIWENNPHITPLSEQDPGVEQIKCSYPLIDHANKTPHHCLHGFIDFLNERLQLSVRPTAFKGDIHLSAQEKAWFSQVHEVARQGLPFWIVAAGGKYDITIKWWQSERYQKVVDHFSGKIQFVQVGNDGHHHPRLDGVIDLRGRTSLRELIRLVYHSQGVLCSVTALMHLAAAVETGPGQPSRRPCVVVAGGREPAHWEAYPDHQFMHTNGALPCCADGGCWRERISRLRDGDPRDRPDSLCLNVVHGIPRCMDMITPEEVSHRVEIYFQGGQLEYLTRRQVKAARWGILATAKNPYDNQPLSIHNAGTACERFIRAIPPCPGQYEGRGIVICGGGARYFTNAWVCINMLRQLGCRLPIQLWHLGKAEMDDAMRDLAAPLGVQCIDARAVRKRFPVRILRGWELKPYALVHCPFREALLLDADNVPVVNPEFLFETPEFQKNGAVFWPDYAAGKNKKGIAIWRSCGLRWPNEPEFETGQIVLDKERCWPALRLTLWFNENSDFYYQYLHGDKETFHLAFRKLRQTYSLIPTPIHPLEGTMCQHDFNGRRIFQHRNTDKWDVFLGNRRVKDFWFEDECRDYVLQLRRVWDGGVGLIAKHRWPPPVPLRRPGRRMKIAAVMISCAERKEVRERTLKNLSATDWGDQPLHVEIDEGKGGDHQKRQTRCAFLALRKALERDADFILFLEDDLEFNRHIRRNLHDWKPVRTETATLASLYNPRVRELACDVRNQARIVDPNSMFGSQALLISQPALQYVLQNWHKVGGMQDIKISRLAGRLKTPVFYHAPSLVQHVGVKSVWGGGFHQAWDFDADWKAGLAVSG